MQKDIACDRIKDIVCDILGENKIELVSLSFKKEGHKRVLRITADREGGITVDECARMNHLIGEVLGREDFIRDTYVLEVSSPGLDRPLKTKEDFLKLKGKKIRAHTYEPIGGRREFVGVLQSVEGDHISVGDESSQPTRIPLEKISKATFDYRSLL